MTACSMQHTCKRLSPALQVGICQQLLALWKTGHAPSKKAPYDFVKPFMLATVHGNLHFAKTLYKTVQAFEQEIIPAGKPRPDLYTLLVWAIETYHKTQHADKQARYLSIAQFLLQESGLHLEKLGCALHQLHEPLIEYLLPILAQGPALLGIIYPLPEMAEDNAQELACLESLQTYFDTHREPIPSKSQANHHGTGTANKRGTFQINT